MTQPTPSERDNLLIALERTEARLAEKLEEACVPDTRDVSDESTAELAKLSDSLLAAAHAAKDVISLRQRRREKGGRTATAPDGGSIREFSDRDAKEWRVWAVTPALSRGSRRESPLGDFEMAGWCSRLSTAAGANGFHTTPPTGGRCRMRSSRSFLDSRSRCRLAEQSRREIREPARPPEPLGSCAVRRTWRLRRNLVHLG